MLSALVSLARRSSFTPDWEDTMRGPNQRNRVFLQENHSNCTVLCSGFGAYQVMLEHGRYIRKYGISLPRTCFGAYQHVSSFFREEPQTTAYIIIARSCLCTSPTTMQSFHSTLGVPWEPHTSDGSFISSSYSSHPRRIQPHVIGVSRTT